MAAQLTPRLRRSRLRGSAAGRQPDLAGAGTFGVLDGGGNQDFTIT